MRGHRRGRLLPTPLRRVGLRGVGLRGLGLRGLGPLGYRLLRLLPGLVLHNADGEFTLQAQDVLSDGAALDWG